MKRNKRAQIEMQGSFLYDLVFGVMLAVILLSFVSTIDSGLYYWREYYSQDLSATLSLIEGVSDDISINYVVVHNRNFIKSTPLELGIQILKGKVGIFNRDNDKYKTEKNFITKKGSELKLDAVPLEALTISNKKGKLTLQSTASASCSLFNIDKKEFIKTKFSIIKEDQFALFELIKQTTYSAIEQKYLYELSSRGAITELRNKLLTNNLYSSDLKDVVVLFKFKYSDIKSINIKHSAKGNSKLANNFACNLLGYLEQEYENSIVIGSEKIPIFMDTESSNNINDYNNPNAAVILIEFKSNTMDDFAILPNTFARILSYSLEDITSSANEKTIKELLTKYNIENE